MDSIYNKNCISCQKSSQKKISLIYEDEHCKVILRDDNQCWLGRFIVVPHIHIHPFDFWINKQLMTHIMKIYVRFSKAIQRAFGAITVHEAQIGALTKD